MNLLARIRSWIPKPAPAPAPPLKADPVAATSNIIRHLRDQVETLRHDRDELVDQAAALETRAAKLSAALSEEREKLALLTSVHEDAVRKLEDLAGLAGENAALTVRIGELERELASKQASLDELSSSMGAVLFEKDALLGGAQVEIEQLRSELIRLKGGEQQRLNGVPEDEPGKASAEPEVVFDHTSEMALQIVRISFRDGNVWHFSRGDGDELNARIMDQAFLERVHAREVTFGDRDVIRAWVHAVTTRLGYEEIKTAYEVVEVLEVIPPPSQTSMPLVAAAAPAFVLALASPDHLCRLDWAVWLLLALAIVSVIGIWTITLALFVPSPEDRREAARRERMRREELRQSTEEVLP